MSDTLPTCETCKWAGLRSENMPDMRVCRHEDLDMWVPDPFGCVLHETSQDAAPAPASPSLAARLSDEVLLKADEAFDDTFALYQYKSIDPNEPAKLAFAAMRAVLLAALQGPPTLCQGFGFAVCHIEERCMYPKGRPTSEAVSPSRQTG